MSRNLHCLPKQCSLETDQKSRTQQDRRVIGCIHMYLLYTLDLLSVIYIFEEKKKAFLRSFFHALIIFCSSSPHPSQRLSVRLRQINSCSALASQLTRLGYPNQRAICYEVKLLCTLMYFGLFCITLNVESAICRMELIACQQLTT